MDSIVRLQQWYLSQCNGDWEHSFGIKIDTLDNPGWSVKIDVQGTSLEDTPMSEIKVDKGVQDWIFCHKKELKFLGRGDPLKLEAIILHFLKHVT